MNRTATRIVLLLAVFVVALAERPAGQQALQNQDRQRWADVLTVIKNDVLKHYYDPTFRRLNVEAHFKQAQQKMAEAQSLSQLFGIIAQALVDFEDSHLFFLPPDRSSQIEYGWRMGFVGDRAFITAVKADSDAAAKGIAPGDQLMTLDGREVTRDNYWKLQYLYRTLRPVARVQLVVAPPGGAPRQVEVMTKITPRQRVLNLANEADINEFLRRLERSDEELAQSSQTTSFGDNEVMLWRFDSFVHERAEVDRIMSTARKHKALILDLRGNGGGSVETLQRIVSNLFDRDVSIGIVKERTETKPMVAKTRGTSNTYQGHVVVLVDSDSASAAEMLARVVQLEQRGTVMGDTTSGAVMQSRFFTHTSGLDVIAIYGVSVTVADVLMKDGQSLEKVGVTPDKPVRPTPADMAARRDPVLSQALAHVGYALDPTRAGAVLPKKW